MAAADAVVFPPKNVAYRLAIAFRDSTGALITGWTVPTSVVVADGVSLGAGGTPTEVGATGLGYLDLTAPQMNGALIQVSASVTNAGAIPYVAFIYTGGQSQIQTAILAAITAISTFDWNAAAIEVAGAPTTYIGYAMRAFQILGNKWVRDGAAQRSYGADQATVKLTATVIDGQTSANRTAYQ
jgi:hypothetical protein